MFKNQEKNFILQQGFAEPSASSCPLQYRSLLFQPWVVFALVALGAAFQSAPGFAALSAVLFWSALVPKLNPFDALYNALWGRRPAAIRLTPAPSPRRFSQIMAGTFSLAIALSLNFAWLKAARVLQGLFLLAIILLVSGGFCSGSVVFHALRRRFQFAKQTMPWA